MKRLIFASDSGTDIEKTEDAYLDQSIDFDSYFSRGYIELTPKQFELRMKEVKDNAKKEKEK